MRIEEGFNQEHPYRDDAVLSGILERYLEDCDSNIKEEVEKELLRLGDDLIRAIRPLAPLVQPAQLEQYDHWGRRVDNLRTSEGWRILEESAIREGYVSIGYDKKYGQYARLFMFAKTMIMTGDYHVIMCPMGMTDGAAKVLELSGTPEMKRDVLPRLLSRNPADAFLSGQWMTESSGGSDVSQTETTASPTGPQPSDLGPPYLLNGFKWFSSAGEGHMAVVLARTGTVQDGSRGLSLFLVPLRMNGYNSPLNNGVRMHRLKNKIGTFGVPTAELSLEGTRAWRIGPINQGIKLIVPVLNITRIHSAIHCIGSLQRAISIARSYATVRAIDGGKTLLQNVPLHTASLARVALLYRALAQLTFGAVVLLGKVETGTATADEDCRLRLLTPAIKGYASQKVPAALEECMASLGGLGYMEETGIGRLIRDCLVEQIWEGTINILALDLMRACKVKSNIQMYTQWGRSILHSSHQIESLSDIQVQISNAVKRLEDLLMTQHQNSLLARTALNLFAFVSCTFYLLEHAVWAYNSKQPHCHLDIAAVRRWVTNGELDMLLSEINLTLEDPLRASVDQHLVYGSADMQAKM